MAAPTLAPKIRLGTGSACVRPFGLPHVDDYADGSPQLTFFFAFFGIAGGIPLALRFAMATEAGLRVVQRQQDSHALAILEFTDDPIGRQAILCL